MKRKDKMHLVNKEKAIKLVGFIVFMVIIIKVFCSVTYLFRGTGLDRNNIVGIENEKLDMVYIDGSAATMYWQPLKAWNDCGFTSYNYATHMIQAENIKAYLEEARKSQNPELFVIGVRAFEYYSDEEEEAGLRRGSDGMDITSISRYKLINEYFSNRDISAYTHIAPYYFDIEKYHTNTGNLASPEAWSLINNKGVSPDKGWEWFASYKYIDTPVDFDTEVRADLLPNCKKILIDLLEYCREEELKVIFVVSPYQIFEWQQEKYNTIGDIIESYGFDFINTNLCYNEMGIDFSTDFADGSHVNLFGAEKYTEFLEKYILDNYDMPDHRGDEEYSLWNEDYKRFVEERADYAKIITEFQLEDFNIEEQIINADVFFEWNDLIEDKRFTILMTADESLEWPESLAEQKILEKWGFSKLNLNGIKVISNNNVICENAADGKNEVEGWLLEGESQPYYISIEDGISTIMIIADDYSLKKKGMNIVVYDKKYRKVIDSVVIYSKNRKLFMER